MKKALSLTLVLMMALSLFGGMAFATEEQIGKYDPPIELTVTNSVASGYKFREGEDLEHNVYTGLYRDEMGINLNFMWTLTSGDTDQKVNVTIASGDLPDLMRVNALQLKQLVDSGMVYDLTELYEQYASPATREVLISDGGDSMESAKFEGRLMALPNLGSNYDSASMIWVRQDWLEKLGLELPETMEDVMNVARAFAQKDPDGNGQNDTFGLSLQQNLFAGIHSIRGLMDGFHAYPNAWVEKDGQLAFGSVQPEVKEALLTLQEMFKEGLIDPEFGVKDEAKVNEDLIANKHGLLFGTHANCYWPLQGTRDLDENAQWRPIPIVSVDEEPAKPLTSLAASSYYVVAADCAHPEAVIRMFNYINELCYGENGDIAKYMVDKTTTPGVQYYIYQLSPIYTDNARKNVAYYRKTLKYLENGDTSDMNADELDVAKLTKEFIDTDGADAALWGNERWAGPEGAMGVIAHYMDNDLIMADQFIAARTPTMAEKYATLEKMQNEVFTKIIMNVGTGEDFDKFVEDWYALGGEQITQEVNDWYQTTKE